MTSPISQLNASRKGRKTLTKLTSNKKRPSPGEATTDWNQTRVRSAKPRVNVFSAESRKRGQMWEENASAAAERSYKHEREVDDFEATAIAEGQKSAISVQTLHDEAVMHGAVAQALAKLKQHAVAEAVHNGKSLAVYASNAIRFVETSDGIDGTIAKSFAKSVRRVTEAAFLDWEAAALGVDVDQSVLGEGK